MADKKLQGTAHGDPRSPSGLQCIHTDWIQMLTWWSQPKPMVPTSSEQGLSQGDTPHTVPPARQARSIPRNQIKTVTDAWKGYHPIPINAEDRDKLTFITEDGRYRYCCAPMGFLSSRDAYTHRYDLIIADVPQLTKCMDDVMLYDDIADAEGH